MRWLKFTADGQTSWGIVERDRVIAVSDSTKRDVETAVGLSQAAGMGWTPSEMNRREFLWYSGGGLCDGNGDR